MLDRCPTQLISSYLDKIIAPMVKTLSSYVNDSQHTLEIFGDFYFLGQKTTVFYSILFYSTLRYYIKSNQSLSRLLIPSLKQFVKVVPLSRFGFLSFK